MTALSQKQSSDFRKIAAFATKWFVTRAAFFVLAGCAAGTGVHYPPGSVPPTMTEKGDLLEFGTVQPRSPFDVANEKFGEFVQKLGINKKKHDPVRKKTVITPCTAHPSVENCYDGPR